MKPAGAACLNCPCRDNKIVLPEKARAPGKTKLAVVGEAPGREEIREGRPFIGASGRLMMKELKRLGPSRADVHWTNAILCECPKEHQAAAAKACSERLRAELEIVDPIVVLPVGAWSLSSTLGVKKKLAIIGGKNRPPWRGAVMRRSFAEKTWNPEGETGSLITGTVHPAFILRGGDKWQEVFRRDVSRAVRLVFEGWIAPEKQEGRIWGVADDYQKLNSNLNRLGPEVSFDVETLEAPATETPLVCFGVSDGTLTVVVPWTKERSAITPYWAEQHLATEIVSCHLSKRTVVTHNGPSFDDIVASRYGIDLGTRRHDTITAYHVLESHLPKALPHVVTQYLDVPPWKGLENRTADLARLYSYNMQDCLYTILTWQKMKPLLGLS